MDAVCFDGNETRGGRGTSSSCCIILSLVLIVDGLCVIAVFLYYYQSKGLVSNNFLLANNFIEFNCDWLTTHFKMHFAFSLEKIPCFATI